MDEQLKNLLLLKSNSPIKERKTIFSIHNKDSFSSLVSINNNNNKHKFTFQSFAKQYGRNQLESVNDKRRIAKTPKNFIFKSKDKKQNIMKRAKTYQTLKQSNTRIANESYDRSENLMGQKIDMDLININISILAFYFKSIYPDQIRIKKFNDEFKNKNIEGYEEILLLMKEFKDFNIFDYLNIYSGNSFFLTKEKQEERNKNLCKRNNIILSLLIEHEYLKEKEDKGIIVYRKNMKIFQRTEFLLPLLEHFKTILIHLNHNEIALEVEVLILALLDYYEYAESIYKCHIRYLMNY